MRVINICGSNSFGFFNKTRIFCRDLIIKNRKLLIGYEAIDNKYSIVDLKDKPELKNKAATWFSQKWNVAKDEYLKCMNDYLNGKTNYGWYLCLDNEEIIAGLGVIENDFHKRKDLTPNVCAVYTEKKYRNQGIAKRLLDYVVEECRKKEISPLYLLTDHTNFYEKCGWEFLCLVQNENEPTTSRMYIHR